MLAYILAIIVAIGSLAMYLAAFFIPQVHRKGDLIWSGVGLFYALTLWACAGRITGAVLLGQTASVALLSWFGWQTFQFRRQTPHLADAVSFPTPEKIAALTSPENLKKTFNWGGLLPKTVSKSAKTTAKTEPSTNNIVSGVSEGFTGTDPDEIWRDAPEPVAPPSVVKLPQPTTETITPQTNIAPQTNEVVTPVDTKSTVESSAEMWEDVGATDEFNEPSLVETVETTVAAVAPVLPLMSEPTVAKATEKPVKSVKTLAQKLPTSNLLNKAKSAWQGLVSKLAKKSGDKPLKKVVDQVTTTATEMGEKVSEMGEKVSEKLAETTEAIGDKLTDLKTEGQEQVLAVVERVKEGVSAGKESVTEAIEPVISSASNMVTDVTEKVGEMLTPPANLKEKLADVKDTVAEAIEYISDEASDLKSKVGQVATNVTTKVVETAKTVKQTVEEVGNTPQANQENEADDSQTDDPKNDADEPKLIRPHPPEPELVKLAQAPKPLAKVTNSDHPSSGNDDSDAGDGTD